MANIDRIFRIDRRINQDGVYTISRSENVKDALKNRFSVFPRTVPFRPDYGVNLKRFQDEPLTSDLESRIIKEVRVQILRDPRVKAIRAMNIRKEDTGEIEIEAEVILVGEDDQINFRVLI